MRRGNLLRADNPPTAEDAGMALCEALMERQVTWDGAAAVEEYRALGKSVEGSEVICRPDGAPLSSLATWDIVD